jgi:hypothetical protein
MRTNASYVVHQHGNSILALDLSEGAEEGLKGSRYFAGAIT